MALVKSRRWRNWVAVSFASTTFDGVKKIGMNRGIQDLQDSADNDLGPTIAMVILQNPSFSVNTTNAYALIGLAAGVKGVFTATHCDANNGPAAGGGAIIITTNSLSYIGEDSVDGSYNELGTDSLTIKTCWIDGVTNPVTVTAA